MEPHHRSLPHGSVECGSGSRTQQDQLLSTSRSSGSQTSPRCDLFSRRAGAEPLLGTGGKKGWSWQAGGGSAFGVMAQPSPQQEVFSKAWHMHAGAQLGSRTLRIKRAKRAGTGRIGRRKARRVCTCLCMCVWMRVCAPAFV